MYIMCVMFFQCFESGVGALQISIVIIIILLFLPFFNLFLFFIIVISDYTVVGCLCVLCCCL